MEIAFNVDDKIYFWVNVERFIGTIISINMADDLMIRSGDGRVFVRRPDEVELVKD